MPQLKVLVVSTLAVLLLSHGADTAGQSTDRQQPHSSTSERLYVANIGPTRGVVDRLHQAESDRLDGLCNERPLGCRSNSFMARRTEVGVLLADPRIDAPVIGTIFAALEVRRSGDHEFLDVALDVEVRQQPGVYRRWIESLGDWFYGVYVEGVRVQNQWVQIVSPKAVQGWLPPEMSGLGVLTSPLEGSIVGLERLNARWPDETRAPIKPGNFLILSVKGSDIEFREEVEADFACGEQVALPPVMPPTLRTTADEFFNADGSSRFSIVYGKGC